MYERVSCITDQMLTAARADDWDALIALEAQCALHIDMLRQQESGVILPEVERDLKARIISKILADDREIRSLTELWMVKLSALLSSTGTKRKLSQAYS